METFLGLRSDTCFKERDTHRKTDRDIKGEIERKKNRTRSEGDS